MVGHEYIMKTASTNGVGKLFLYKTLFMMVQSPLSKAFSASVPRKLSFPDKNSTSSGFKCIEIGS